MSTRPREITEKMGGQLRVSEQDAGPGTTLEVWLPLDEPVES
jgi:signal transduction histidine kinase